MQQFLGRFSREEHLSKTVTFSYLTTPGLFQTAMESAVEKRQVGKDGLPGLAASGGAGAAALIHTGSASSDARRPA